MISPAILMTRIKLSEPKELSKPTTGFNPPDSETQAAIGRYKSLQEIGGRDPGIQNSGRLMRYMMGLTGNQMRRIDAHPSGAPARLARLAGMTDNTEMTAGPEFMEAAGMYGPSAYAPDGTFFQDLTRTLGFGGRRQIPDSGTLRDAVRSVPGVQRAAETADHVMTGLRGGVGRDLINRRLTNNAYGANLVDPGGSNEPRVFFDRKNQLRNY